MKFRNLFLAVTLLALSPLAMAATSDTLNMRVPQKLGTGVQVVKCTVDFAKSTTQTADAYTQIFDIPAGSVVLGMRAKVITAQGATCTTKVGTDVAGQSSLFSATFNLNSAATTWIAPTTAGGVFYSTATVLRFLHNSTTTKAKVIAELVLIPPPPANF